MLRRTPKMNTSQQVIKSPSRSFVSARETMKRPHEEVPVPNEFAATEIVLSKLQNRKHMAIEIAVKIDI